jgi:transposase
MSNSRRRTSAISATAGSTQVSTNSTPALFVGIDWSDKKHDVCWIAADGRRGQCVIEQSPEQIEELLARLTELAHGGVIAVALEKSRGPLFYALLGREGLRLYPLDPKQVARYRDSFASSRAKSDASDAALLARLLCERYHELPAWRPDDEPTRRVAHLSQIRRDLVDENTRLKLQLQAALKTYFPLALAFGEADSDLVLELLRRWPDPRELRRVHPKTLATFFREHRVKNQDRVQELIDRIRRSPLVTQDRPVIESLVFRVAALVGQLQSLRPQIEKIETAIDQAMAAHADAPLFQSIPGAGRALAPRLLAAFGSDRERYAHADEVTVVSGIAPVTRQSGQTKFVTRRRACSRFLKQTFHEFADQARKWCPWSRAYYAWQRSQKVAHHAALRKLASRWIRILFKVWKSRTPYNPTRYLQRLHQLNHPLLKFLELQTSEA